MGASVSNTLNSLNDEQKLAVTSTEGYIRVIAGAGSGKTKALTYRFAYLVDDCGISTANILCVTFTNRAANEMKKRIRSMIGDKDTGYICTFHSFCVQILKEEIHVLNYPKNFLIIDSDDQNTILSSIFEEMGLNSKNYTFSRLTDMIAVKKDKEPYLEDILCLDNAQLKEKIQNARSEEEEIFLRYLYEQKKCYALDFDDLLNFVLYIFHTHGDIQQKWQQRLEYIMVDEFQDVSEKQYRLVKILSEYHHNLFIVGDPDQTIYTWRGARVDFILNFDKDFPSAQTIMMTKNYRSSPNILKASNSLIQKNKRRIDKDLVPVRNIDIPVVYTHAKSPQKEAEWIVSQIKVLQEGGAKLPDIAVLYRSHYLSRSLEEAFIKEKIKYTIYSGIEFYKRKEIKDVLCYLRMVAYADDLSFARIVNIPRRNLGEKRLSFLKDYAENNDVPLYTALNENLDDKAMARTKANEFVDLIESYKTRYTQMKVSELLSGILNDSGYEAMLRTGGEQERLDNLAELKQSIFEYENTAGEEYSLEDYLDKMSLWTNADQSGNVDSVRMMTVHTAKGLEFPFVFVCGLNEGIFPSKHTNTLEKMEEERRLAYVALTRAENALFLSDSEGLDYDGMLKYPSRFIFNIKKSYLNYTVELGQSFIEESQSYIEKSENKLDKSRKFQVNDMVVHDIFGEGTVIDVNMTDMCYRIQFEKIQTPRNISFDTKLKKFIKQTEDQ